MARPRKPAVLKAGKSETKEHLDNRAKVEADIKGNSDLVENIPDQLDLLGKKYYAFLYNQLKASNILSNLDIPVLTQTADCLSKMEQADKIIAEFGLIYETLDKMGNDIPKEHPAVGIKQKYLSQFRALSTQLGLSPSARASLSEMTMQQKEDDEDQFLKIINKNKD